MERTSGYTVMDNCHLRDQRLGLKAKGLLSLMLSLPDSWDYTERGLAAIVPDGLDTVRSALKELERNGYLTRERKRENGRLGGTVYTVRESPAGTTAHENEDAAEPIQGNPIMDNPIVEKPVLENPILEKPITGKPILENPPQIKKEKTKKEESIPPKAPRGAPVHSPERFAGFWAMYPRHEKKPAAIRAWDRLALDDAEIDDLARGLNWFLRGEQWRRGIGIPYASTWLNGRRWEERHDAVMSFTKTDDGTVEESEGAYPL